MSYCMLNVIGYELCNVKKQYNCMLIVNNVDLGITSTEVNSPAYFETLIDYERITRTQFLSFFVR